MTPIPVTVIRHPKERVAKCSLRTLHGREGFTFLRASHGMRFDATGHLLLAVDAPPLTIEDRGHPILIAGYYDQDPTRVRDWLAAADAHGGAVAVMYTTWRNDYAQLERFAELVRVKRN